MPKDQQWWKDYAWSSLHTGSQVICNPPPKTETDDDWLLLLEPKLVAPLEEALAAKGFAIGGSMSVIGEKRPDPVHYHQYEPWLKAVTRWELKQQRNNETSSLKSLEQFPDFNLSSNPIKNGIFRSWKDTGSPCTNLILTCSEEYFSNFSKATALAQRLNLLSKEDRVAVFEAVVFDRWPSISNRSRKETSFSISPGSVNTFTLGVNNTFSFQSEGAGNTTTSGANSTFANQWGTWQVSVESQQAPNGTPTLSMDEQF